MYARIDRSSPTPAAAAHRFGATKQPPVGNVLLRGLSVLALWQERWRQRRHLEAMEHRAMQDLALSRADIYRETSKPFWVR